MLVLEVRDLFLHFIYGRLAVTMITFKHLL